jgi:hypothetical protein
MLKSPANFIFKIVLFFILLFLLSGLLVVKDSGILGSTMSGFVINVFDVVFILVSMLAGMSLFWLTYVPSVDVLIFRIGNPMIAAYVFMLLLTKIKSEKWEPVLAEAIDNYLSTLKKEKNK